MTIQKITFLTLFSHVSKMALTIVGKVTIKIISCRDTSEKELYSHKVESDKIHEGILFLKSHTLLILATGKDMLSQLMY